MAHQFLANHDQPSDQLFLFNFSCGAFTVRCVTGMINRFGLVRSEPAVLLPMLLRVYFAKVRTDGTERGQVPGTAPLGRDAVAAQMCESPASPIGHHVKVQFAGVWDTVASAGLPRFLLQISSGTAVRGENFRPIR